MFCLLLFLDSSTHISCLKIQTLTRICHSLGGPENTVSTQQRKRVCQSPTWPLTLGVSWSVGPPYWTYSMSIISWKYLTVIWYFTMGMSITLMCVTLQMCTLELMWKREPICKELYGTCWMQSSPLQVWGTELGPQTCIYMPSGRGDHPVMPTLQGQRRDSRKLSSYTS